MNAYLIIEIIIFIVAALFMLIYNKKCAKTATIGPIGKLLLIVYLIFTVMNISTNAALGGFILTLVPLVLFILATFGYMFKGD